MHEPFRLAERRSSFLQLPKSSAGRRQRKRHYALVMNLVMKVREMSCARRPQKRGSGSCRIRFHPGSVHCDRGQPAAHLPGNLPLPPSKARTSCQHLGALTRFFHQKMHVATFGSSRGSSCGFPMPAPQAGQMAGAEHGGALTWRGKYTTFQAIMQPPVTPLQDIGGFVSNISQTGGGRSGLILSLIVSARRADAARRASRPMEMRPAAALHDTFRPIP